MEFIKPGTYIDFMKYRAPVMTVLGLMATLSLVSLFYPGPNYGIDFAGGTEVQLLFKGDTTSSEIRKALQDSGYARPDVISVEDQPNEYIIRVQEVSSLPDQQVEKIRGVRGSGAWRGRPAGDESLTGRRQDHAPRFGSGQRAATSRGAHDWGRERALDQLADR